MASSSDETNAPSGVADIRVGEAKSTNSLAPPPMSTMNDIRRIVTNPDISDSEYAVRLETFHERLRERSDLLLRLKTANSAQHRSSIFGKHVSESRLRLACENVED
uniref:Uncharacterized protein n=1 Tax=Ditylum brightwellii TaxID=49249 RepID=A0A7S4T040_9STRA|mmetsp:Transcript_64058/g.95052  ORF Transcript_64058/g.95052 Transcript_64058/m.95052 type:complete len:106 (+) Transcript_64058:239-556(+)